MVNEAQLAQFCDAVSAMRAAYFAKAYPNVAPEPIGYQLGKKYARIVSDPERYPSAYCFVRLEDGAILKAASWASPAKGVRGNIANGAADLNVFGAKYLR